MKHKLLFIVLLLCLVLYAEPKKAFLRENKMASDFLSFGDTKGKFATIIDTMTYSEFRYRLTGSTLRLMLIIMFGMTSM